MRQFWAVISEMNSSSKGFIAKCAGLALQRGLELHVFNTGSGGPEHEKSVRMTLEDMYYHSLPEAIIFERTDFLACVAPAFAIGIGRGITADCTDLRWDDEKGLIQIRPTFGGRMIAYNISLEKPYIATVRPGTFSGEAKLAVPIEIHSLPAPEADPAYTLLQTFEGKSGGVELESAPVIFSGGLGLGSKANYEKLKELSRLAGAELGASRAAVAAGFADYCHQVGQTGVTVKPKVYVAFGISGAVQHLSGIIGAKKIVAVNIDPKAPIRDFADLYIQCDAVKMIDMLLEKY